jgi:hypothetical protein
MRRTILRPALTALGADQLRHLELHHLRRTALTAYRNTSACSSSTTFLTTSSTVILSATGHRWRLLSSNLEKSDDHERRVAGTTSFRPNPTYTTLRDVTRECLARQVLALQAGRWHLNVAARGARGGPPDTGRGLISCRPG